jgi:hypothetical protein
LPGSDVTGANSTPAELPPQDERQTTEPPPISDSLEETLSTSSITADEVDFILRDGGNDKNSVLRIAAYFAKDLHFQANADYLQDEYLKGCYKYHSSRNGGFAATDFYTGFIKPY